MTRQARGEVRRRQLAATAAEVLESEGFPAVTHRAVGARAGSSVGLVTYYFPGHDDLVDAALAEWVSSAATRMDEVAGALPRRRRSAAGTARALADVLVDPERAADGERLTQLYECFIDAARHPRHRQAVRELRSHLDAACREVLDRSGRSQPDPAALDRLVALSDGTILSALAEGRGDVRAAVVAALTAVLQS